MSPGEILTDLGLHEFEGFHPFHLLLTNILGYSILLIPPPPRINYYHLGLVCI